jgi:hypothetical protein
MNMSRRGSYVNGYEHDYEYEWFVVKAEYDSLLYAIIKMVNNSSSWKGYDDGCGKTNC